MRRKNLLKELGIQKQADTSCNALDIDTENIRQRVYTKLDFADTERKQTTMRSKKKILPLLIAATLTIGATAVAATGKISMWTGSSASRAAYTSLPTAEQVTKDIGYSPVLIDTFENGYCFKDGNIVKNSFKDDNANVIEKFKSVSFDYQKNGDVVSFEQQKFNSKLTPAGDIIAVREELKQNGRYVIVVGDSNIRGQSIPTAKVLAEIAEKNGYIFELSFKYVIRDRYLHLPRGNRGGIIKYDEILVLKKK